MTPLGVRLNATGYHDVPVRVAVGVEVLNCISVVKVSVPNFGKVEVDLIIAAVANTFCKSLC